MGPFPREAAMPGWYWAGPGACLVLLPLSKDRPEVSLPFVLQTSSPLLAAIQALAL